MHNIFYILSNLGPIGLWVVYALMVVTLLYVAYRFFGVIGILVLLIVLFFVYVGYSHDLLSRYNERQESNTNRIRLLEEELNR